MTKPSTIGNGRLPVLAAILFTGLALAPLGAGAHAVVTESSLRHTAIEVNKAAKVVLNFNSNVELELSRVFLVSKGDVHQPAQIEKGKKPGEVIVHIPALSEGDYAIKYKVFAADGHLTEDVIRFKVSAQR